MTSTMTTITAMTTTNRTVNSNSLGTNRPGRVIRDVKRRASPQRVTSWPSSYRRSPASRKSSHRRPVCRTSSSRRTADQTTLSGKPTSRTLSSRSQRRIECRPRRCGSRLSSFAEVRSRHVKVSSADGSSG